MTEDRSADVHATQDLLDENERLRALAATLERERLRLAERARSVEHLLHELDALRGANARLEREKDQVLRQLLHAREELDAYARDGGRPEGSISV